MRVISRRHDDGIDVFDARLDLLHTVPFPAGSPADEHAVSAARDRLVVAGAEGVTCVDVTGRELWRWPVRPGDPASAPAPPISCAWSGDDALVWIYLPNTEAGRAEPDQWLALDPADGTVRHRHDLATAGQAGQQLATPDGRYMLLEVDEGRSGSATFRAGPGDALHRYPWNDRALVAVAPDGRRLMTVENGQEEVAFHDFPDGGIRVRVPLSAFATALGPDIDPGEVFLEWTGGFLDDVTAIVVISGEDSRDGDWWRHFRVDSRTGEVLGELHVVTVDAYDLQPLGDGTFLITDTDGTMRLM